MKYEVVIIGSGLGGLVCAHILSKAGKRVLVLEKNSQPGGCLQSYRRDGLTFDTGFHYVGGLGEGQSLHTVFRMLGLMRLPWQRLDESFDRIRIGEQEFSFMQGYDNFVKALQARFPDEGEALRQYAGLLQRTEEEQLGLLAPDAALSSETWFETGAWTYLTAHFHSPLLVNVLSATSLKMELRKESLPLFTFLHGNSSFIESSWKLRGAGSLIADSLIRDIRSQGGEVICRATVEELVEKDRKLVGLRCMDGRFFEGDCFVSDVHPAVTCSWIKRSECLRSIYRRRIGALENTFGMLTVSLALKPRSVKYFNWNWYVYRNPDVWTFYQDNIPVKGVLVCARPPEDGGDYLQQLDLLTPITWEKMAPWIQTRVGHRDETYSAMKRQLADECVRLAERVIPGLRNEIVQTYVSTPLTYRDYTGTPEGSAYGLRKDYRNPMMTLLSPRTPLPNLFLTGQSLMLHGIQGVTMTSLFTCAEILGKEYMWNQLKKSFL